MRSRNNKQREFGLVICHCEAGDLCPPKQSRIVAGDCFGPKSGSRNDSYSLSRTHVKHILVCLDMLFAWLLVACTPQVPVPTPTPSGPRTLKVMTHDSFAVSEGVIDAFMSQDKLKVQFLKAGDAGTALNKAILAKGNPLADVFYGVDNTFLSRALQEGIYDPYASPLLADIPDALKLDLQQRALPVDYADVCLDYDKAYFSQKNLAPPQTLEDLLKPEYKGLLVVENPATSSPGLSFLLATIGHFGQAGYLDYWKGLVANDVKVVDGWEQAYYTDFSGSSGKGPRPVVVSYDTDPAFEVINAATPIDESPIAAIIADGSCYRQIEFVGILKGTANRDLAEKFIDFMLSPQFQEDVPLQMYVLPANSKAKIDPTLARFLVPPQKPISLKPEDIAANREAWIKAWTEAVLQ